MLTESALLRWEVLLDAYHSARLGKRHNASVDDWARDYELRLLRLQERLRAGYRFGPYTPFLVRDPKPRDIAAAPFADRVIHHAIVALCGPRLSRGLCPTCFACRVGLGGAAAQKALLKACRSGTARYFMKCDVRRYFPSLRHAVLRAQLAPALGDAFAGRLIDALLASWHTDGAPGTGIPIGNLTSQLFANVYLGAVDHYMLRTVRAKSYLRYVDDMVWFGPDKAILWQQLRALEERLRPLGLGLHPGKTRLGRVVDGVDFCGMVASPTWLRLRGPSKRRGLRHLGVLRRRFHRGQTDRETYLKRLRSFVAHLQSVGATGLLAARGLAWTR